MPAANGKTAATFSTPVLNQTLYVVLTRVTALQAKAAPHKSEHIAYLTGLEAQGKVFASGPFPMPDDSFDLGMIIFRTSSREEAENLIRAEPMTAMGLSTYELYEWKILIGEMPITLNLSKGTFSL